MATYNGEEYLAEQFESFVSQTRLPDELVVSDDASTDKTLDIVSEFAKKAPFPVYVLKQKSNVGFAANFNRALSSCRGDIVLLSDQDDVWFDNKVESVIAIFQNPNVCVMVNDAILTDAKLTPSRNTRFGQARRLRQKDAQLVQGACTSVRSDFLGLALPIPASCYSHDHWLHELGGFLGCRTVLNEPLQYFRRHGANVSSASVSQLEDVKRTAVKLKRVKARILRQNDNVGILRRRFYQLSAFRYWWNTNESAILSFCVSHWLGTPRKEGIAEVEAAIRLMDARLKIIEMPRHRRIAPLMSAYMSADHSESKKVREFAKDVIS